MTDVRVSIDGDPASRFVFITISKPGLFNSLLVTRDELTLLADALDAHMSAKESGLPVRETISTGTVAELPEPAPARKSVNGNRPVCPECSTPMHRISDRDGVDWMCIRHG